MALDKLVNSTALDTGLTSIANAIRTKGGTSEQLTFPEGFVDAVEDIPTGGGGGGGSDVIFYDYDGTITNSYSASEFASLAALPANPSHEGLIAQGWNWSLANAKTHVAKYGKLNIGQMYVTQSGATEIDVEMHEGRLEPILTICVDGTITVDWGDDTTPDTVTGSSLSTRLAVPHTYASYGYYTISILATGNNKYSFYGNDTYTILRKNETLNDNHVYANAVKSIRIGNNAAIENYAFQYCYSLSSITIPDGATRIGSCAFQYCYSLSSITIPDGVTSIGGAAFQYCYSLSSITIPDGVTRIWTYTFSYCASLSSITIPDSVTTVDANAFRFAYALSSITIPDGVKIIANQVFQYCYALSSITIPDGVTNISGSALNSCYSLSSITIPDGVTSIGGAAFQYCYSLSSVTVPNSVTNIGINAFSNCFSLTSITIPDGVTSIGNNAFQSCYGMKECHILSTTVPTGGTTMFADIPSDCIIYVPKGHLNDYQTATNWSTYASYMQEEPE